MEMKAFLVINFNRMEKIFDQCKSMNLSLIGIFENMAIRIVRHAPWASYQIIQCGLRMHRECRERLPRHRIQRKPLVSDPGMHHGTCVAHVPCCMSGSPIRGGGETVPGIPGACATRSFTYLARGPLLLWYIVVRHSRSAVDSNR